MRENSNRFRLSIYLDARESLSDLEKPERLAQIYKDYELRKQRAMHRKPVNPLRPQRIDTIDIDDLYLEDEGQGLVWFAINKFNRGIFHVKQIVFLFYGFYLGYLVLLVNDHQKSPLVAFLL